MAVDKTEPNSPQQAPELEPEEKRPAEERDEKIGEPKDPEWVDLLGSGSVMKKILQEGRPQTRPERLDKLTISYDLALEDGTFIEKNDNFQMQLGDSEVVQGLDVALGLMNVGERAMLKIQPRLAFGEVGLPPKIHSNATVIYIVQLVSVEQEEEIELLSLAERKLQGNKKRERGNWWYSRGDHTIAIQCYRRALSYLDEVEEGSADPEKKSEATDAELQSILEDRVSVYNNMAAAQLKLELYDAALTSVQTVLRCQPDNVKALFRKAKVYRGKNDLPEALKTLKRAAEVSPTNKDIQKEITIVTRAMTTHKLTEKELARRMFGEINSNKQEKRNPKNKFLVWSATLVASFAIGLAGVAAYRLKFT